MPTRLPALLQGCHLLSLLLEELEIPAVALHSHQAQRRRLAALDRFKGGVVPVLLATDVASRGVCTRLVCVGPCQGACLTGKPSSTATTRSA